MGRIVDFMEMRHYLSLARQHEETELAERITKANRFYVRITNMARESRKVSVSNGLRLFKLCAGGVAILAIRPRYVRWTPRLGR